MTLTENDILFLQQLIKTSDQNKQGEKTAIKTSTGLLSNQVLELFGIQKTNQGGWFFNVYVEFEPMFKNQPAKEWQT